MKNIFLCILLSLFIADANAQKKLKVVASASMIADMAKNIAGDKVVVECIVPIGGDPHIYAPTPRDAQLVVAGDLILVNGLTFEGWLTELIENAGTKANIVTVTEGVDVIESLDYENSSDPHAWMDLSNGYKYIENIRNALSKVDPANKVYYEARHDAYLQQLKEADKYVMNQVKKIPEDRRILITSHDAFQYYGRRYGIRLEAVLGISTEAEIKTSDVVRLNEVIKKSKVPAVFIESTINPKFLKQLAQDNNIVIGGELYADSLGDEDSEGSTYIDMIKHNTDVIVAALTKDIVTENTTHDHQKGESKTTKFILYGILALLGIGGFALMVRQLNKG